MRRGSRHYLLLLAAIATVVGPLPAAEARVPVQAGLLGLLRITG
jgi:hypothetical protein